MRILVSGFEAFGGHEVNPTSLLIASLNNNEISYPHNMNVRGMILPVSFQDSYETLRQAINEFNPDVVISLGLAEKRSSIELETVAVNFIHASIPDNKGRMPMNEKIIEDGLEAYLSTLPIQGIENALKEAKLPVNISSSAGHYVCNYVFYRLMADNQESLRLCGFIHVPLVKEQSSDAPINLEDLKRALSVIFHYLEY
jgi:pyroglutamyl-peptidase